MPGISIPMAPFFKRIGFFENYQILAQHHSPDNSFNLSLRHVDIIGDLHLLYLWINDPHLLCNSLLLQKDGRLIRHYRKSLESVNRQSFLVDSPSSPVCQFDIFLINLHELYFRMSTSTGDCILTYMLKGTAGWDVRLKSALMLMLDYFFSFPEPQRIWVSIPIDQSALKELFLEAGFSFKTEYTSKQIRYVIFYLRRTGYRLSQPFLH